MSPSNSTEPLPNSPASTASLKSGLTAYGALSIAALVGVTSWASAEKNVKEGFLLLIEERWGIATLLDAYFGFFVFCIWVAYKEPRKVPRLLWIAGVLGLGNIAIGAYLIREASRLLPGDGIEQFLLRRPAAGTLESTRAKRVPA